MKLFVLVLLLFSLVFSAFAQNADVESMKEDLKKAAVDSKEQADLMGKLCWKLRTTDLPNAMKYGQNALEIATKIDYFKGTAKFNNYVGIVYRNMGNFSKATEHFFSALTIAEKYQVEIEMAYAHNNIGEVYKVQKNYDLAFKHTQLAKNSFEKIGDKKGMAYSLIRIGELYEELEKFDKAHNSLLEALEMRKALKDSIDIGAVLMHLAKVSIRQKKPQIAIEYLDKALIMSDKPSNMLRVGWIKKMYADAYFLKKDYKLTISFALDALKSAEKMEAREQVADVFYTLSMAYKETGQLDKAYFYLNKYTEVRNLMFSKETNSLMAALQASYELEKKQVELDKINAQQNFQQIIWRIFAVVILVLSVFIVILYQNKKKQAQINLLLKSSYQEIESKNNDLNLSKLQLSEQADALQINNIALQTTLNELQNAQSALIQSEKMAALGQLVSNIAHEINTPLAAIRSSANTVKENLLFVLSNLPAFIAKHNDDIFKTFENLVAVASENQAFFTSKEKRIQKYAVMDKLSDAKHYNHDTIADMIIEMGIKDDLDKYKMLLENEDCDQIFKLAFGISVIYKANQTIIGATDRASKIIFALKNFARQGQDEVKTKTNLNENIEITLTLYQNHFRQGIELVRHFEKLPFIDVFADSLIQVWTNLIHNATQAMNGKGTLEITTSLEENAILVCVKDNGSGIADEIKDKIFNPFFTTKKAGEGSGLGLDIVKKIVEKHGGKIWLESEIGKGTTFFVRLPIITI